MTFGSLFAGIGGFDLGFERAGMRCVWQVEINPYCRRVLAKHWPDVPRWDDVRTFTGDGFERPDVICGGFPCQDISIAGAGAGIAEGTRSGLWSEYARVVRVVRPRYVVVENVAALLVRGIDRVLGNLASLGYDAEWHCISAASIGAPHIRDRVFILANANGMVGAATIPCEMLDSAKASGRFVRAIGRSGATRGRWLPEPDVGRVVDGISTGMDDSLKGLGNAVVPQVAEWIGRRLMEAA